MTNDQQSITNSDTFHINLRVANNKASGNLHINQNGFYYFVIEDFDGEQNINPIKYSVVALKDDTPSISFLYPTTDVQVTSQAILPIKVAITDDYGFSNLKLHYRLISSKFSSPEEKFSSITIPINSTDLAVEIGYVWDLNKIGIVPEDEYEFYLEIADNDFSNGPKTAKTQTLAVRLPSMAEVAKEADLAQNQISKELDDVKKQAENVKKDIEELERDLLKKDRAKELDWKQQKKLQDIIQKQNQLEQQLNQLSKQVDQTAEQLQQNNMLSEETMQKYQELQQLMKEVKSPELDRMRGMQEKQLQQMTPEELRKAMEQAKFDEERFKKSIERTMEILKRMQAEQKTDAVTKRAEALQKKQDELNKELNNANSNDKNKMNELAKKQDQLKSEMDNLAKDMNDLEDLMKEIGDDMPMQEMKEAMDEMKNDNISQDMENSSNSMEQGDKNNADKSQKSASKKLSQLSKKMQKTKQEMQNKNSKEMVRKMQKSIENMASISKKQEKVKNFTKRSDINSTKVPEISEEQADIFEDLYNVANDINDMGGKSFAITAEMAENVNNALRNMRNTMDQLTDRRMNQAAQMQTSAMKSINAAMMEMQDALAQMQSQGDCDNGSGMGQKNKPGGKGGMGMGMGMGSPGFQQKMQQLAAEQQALNQQMQQLGQGGEGSNGQMSQEQRAAMKRLSGEQDRVRKSMEELAKEQKENGGKPNDKNDGNKLQNELNKMAEEMKEITSEINKGNISPETLQRQEKILSRLLDVTRSVNDRDFENKREANSGKDILQRSPSGIDLSTQEGKTRAMQELMQSIKRGYTKDYEQVIRQYFDAIQKHY
jgi:chromosome segregation ATPase